MRDFYPEEMSRRRWLEDLWRKVSLDNGLLEYDGPILEHLELFTAKSGQEIAGQLFSLTDRAGRDLAIRPEITPTLARMVAARINSLPKPIKWFSMPTLFRGENVQRGRLREFFQWNIDVIGAADMVADAECILVGVEALRLLGLSAADFAVHISSRRLIRAILLAAGIDEAGHDQAYALLDKAGRMDRTEMARRWGGLFGEQLSFAALDELLGVGDLADLGSSLGGAIRTTGELEEAQ